MSHGADTENIKRQFNIGSDLIDYSSNINPVTPMALKKAIIDSIDSIGAYPDIDYVDLRDKIARSINRQYMRSCDILGSGFDDSILDNQRLLSRDNICVGNGASELISLIFRLDIFDKVRVLSPLYSEHIRSSRIGGKGPIISPMKDIYGSDDKVYLSFEDMDLARDPREAIVVCNPGAPDARLRNLDFLVDHCRTYGKYLIIDESFMDFCEGYSYNSGFKYDYGKIIIVKSLTKIYGMPGLRLGYMMARDKSIVEKVRSIQEPWSVNSLAQAGAMAVLEDLDFLEKTRKSYKKEREYLMDELSKMSAIDLYKSDTAYILCSLNDRSKYDTAHDLKMDMVREKSILIRDASSFEGLTHRHFRLAIKSHDLNEVLVDSLRQIL